MLRPPNTGTYDFINQLPKDNSPVELHRANSFLTSICAPSVMNIHILWHTVSTKLCQHVMPIQSRYTLERLNEHASSIVLYLVMFQDRYTSLRIKTLIILEGTQKCFLNMMHFSQFPFAGQHWCIFLSISISKSRSQFEKKNRILGWRDFAEFYLIWILSEWIRK